MKFIVDENIPFIKGRLEPHGEVVYADQFEFTPGLVRDADALIIRTRTQCNEQLLKGSDVKLVATATIGTDQIDKDWCAANGIAVRNAPGCNAPGVAQYVWSSLLRLGLDPAKDTLGVVGAGNVGSIVASWGRALGYKVVVSDPPKQEQGIADNYLPLEELLRVSTAVTLHTPLTASGKHPSHHLIGGREIALMQPGSILINAARGPVLDTDSALPLLKERDITCVIDTWEGEPDLNRALLDYAEIATCHIAGYSHEGKQRATRMVLEAVADTFSLPLDLTGLSGPYSQSEVIVPELIISSYDPYTDTLRLKAEPEKFEFFRNNYNYRHEWESIRNDSM